MTAGRRAYGAFGETLAARHYQRLGYEVVARNWRCKDGELDLVVSRAGLLVFCEVKTRRTDAFGSGFEAVTPAKRARIRRLAARFLADAGGGFRELRFDVVAVTGTRVQVLEGAF
jgi:putative endonuclease